MNPLHVAMQVNSGARALQVSNASQRYCIVSSNAVTSCISSNKESLTVGWWYRARELL